MSSHRAVFYNLVCAHIYITGCFLLYAARPTSALDDVLLLLHTTIYVVTLAKVRKKRAKEQTSAPPHPFAYILLYTIYVFFLFHLFSFFLPSAGFIYTFFSISLREAYNTHRLDCCCVSHIIVGAHSVEPTMYYPISCAHTHTHLRLQYIYII